MTRHYDPQRDEFVEFDVTVVAITQKALLLDNDGDEQWVAASQTDLEHTTVERGQDITIGIKGWVATEIGWQE